MGIHVYLILAMRIITKHSLEQQKHTIKKKKKKLWAYFLLPNTNRKKKKFTETVNKGKQSKLKKDKDEYSEKQEEWQLRGKKKNE